jgi:hypothetical protein
MEYHHLAEIGILLQIALRHIDGANFGGAAFDVEAYFVAVQVITGRHPEICQQRARIARPHLKTKCLIRRQEFGLCGTA